MEISQVRAFVTVAREGGFSGAARKLFRTQPTLSMSVQKLEREVGARLFERSGRGVRLTRAGEILLSSVGPLLEQWEASKTRVRESMDGVPRGSVRVSGEEAAIHYLLAGPLRSFLKRCPFVEPVVRCEPPAETHSGLRSGEIDIGIGPLASPPPDLEYRPFFRSDRMLITARARPLGTSGRLTLSRLAPHPFILPSRGLALRSVLERAFEEAGAHMRTALEASSWETIKQYVGLGLGIAVVPGFCLARADRRLAARSVRHLFGRDTYALILRRGRLLPPAAQLLAREIHPGFSAPARP